MDLRVNALAAVVLAAITVLVAVRVLGAPAPTVGAHATAAQDSHFAASVAGSEAQWRKQSSQDFPADLWSQRDAFHGHEAQSIRELSGSSHVPYEEVIRAIDEDVHRMRGIERSAGAVPCKPRPFYD